MLTNRTRSSTPYLVSAVLFVLLTLVTVWVWRQQIGYRQTLLENHTNEVGFQASRRLELFTAEYLTAISLFVKHWLAHDPSRDEFAEFAVQLMAEYSSYQALALIQDDGTWLVPPTNRTLSAYMDQSGQALLAEARLTGELTLSAPAVGDNVLFYAALATSSTGRHGNGVLVVEINVDTFINSCFHKRIRSEFNFLVQDDSQVLYQFIRDDEASSQAHGPRATRTFSVHNRKWAFTVYPRDTNGGSRWVNWVTLVFGLVLSLCLSCLLFVLLIRIDTTSRARDRAMRDLQKRKIAERALRASELRYKNVFNSVTDALFVCESDGRIVEANQTACTLLSRSAADLVGCPIQSFVTQTNRYRFNHFLQKIVNGGPLLTANSGSEIGPALSVSSESPVCFDFVQLDIAKIPIEVEARGKTVSVRREPSRSSHVVLIVMTDISEREAALRKQAILAQQVMLAQERERSRLSRDLHDELGQLLTALRFELDWLKRQSEQVGVCDFTSAVMLVEKSADELRRVCGGLRPATLDDLGLESAARQLVEEFRERSDVQISAKIGLDEEESTLHKSVAMGTYRILQEALTNIARHANAKNIHISLTRQDDIMVLSISDDGQGFNLDDLSGIQGFGIAGMRERTSLLNGTLEIQSAPAQGTQIVLNIPLDTAHQPTQLGKQP